MADNDNKKGFEIFVTPIGQLEFPWLTKADTRFDPDGVYKTNLILPFEDTLTQELIAKLARVRDDYFQSMDTPLQKNSTKVDVYEEVLDDEGKPTGDIRLKFKLKKKVTTRDGDSFTQSPEVVDADGNDVDAPVYGGSMAALKGQIAPYRAPASKTVGVSLRVKGVKVYELVTGGSGGNFWKDM